MIARILSIALSLSVIASVILHAQPVSLKSPDGLWEAVELAPKKLLPKVEPESSRPTLTKLNYGKLSRHLAKAPPQFELPPKRQPRLLLPMPAGGFTELCVERAPIFTPEGEALHPEITSYRAVGPAQFSRFTVTTDGIRGHIKCGGRLCRIEPVDPVKQPGVHRSTWVTDNGQHLECECFPGEPAPAIDAPYKSLTPSSTGGFTVGDETRTYRLIVACTGEFARAITGDQSPSYNDTWTEIIAIVNGINTLWDSELSINFVLHPTPALISLTSTTDPWQSDAPGAQIGIDLADVQTEFDRYVSAPEDYDVGHLFTANQGGGVAALGCALGTQPAQGRSEATAGVRHISHEIGHQFTAHHTWNAPDFDPGQHDEPSAVEPGAGRTILSYANQSSAPVNNYGETLWFFSWKSADSILSHITRPDLDDAGESLPTTNLPPTITISTLGKHTDGEIHIPFNTPFELKALPSDPNGDPTTVSWEGMDTGPARNLSQTDNGCSPIIGFLMPSPSPIRRIPGTFSLLNGTPPPTFERLPAAPREMDFRATVRDQRGGLASEDLRINVITSASQYPFEITYPNGGQYLNGEITVTWNTGGTETLPEFKAQQVNILLSTDGGTTFNHVLLAGTPNDGAANVTLPGLATDSARIQIKPVDNIFYSFSANNFSILGAVTPTANWAPTIVRDRDPNRSRTYTIAGLASQPTVWRLDVTEPWVHLSVPIGQNIEIPAGTDLEVVVTIDIDAARSFDNTLQIAEVRFIPVSASPGATTSTREVRVTIRESHLVEKFSTANLASPHHDPSLPPWDLANTRVRFVPGGVSTARPYSLYAEPAVAFPHEPGSIEIPLDQVTEIQHPGQLIGTGSYTFFGSDHPSMKVHASRGAIEFSTGGNPVNPPNDVVDFLQQFRGIGAFVSSDGFVPGQGRVTSRQLHGRTVITWEDVLIPGTPATTMSFQVIVYFTGEIEIIYLNNTIVAPITCGLSGGNTVISLGNFEIADFSLGQVPEAEPVILAPAAHYYEGGNSAIIPGIVIVDPDADPSDRFTVTLATSFPFYGSIEVRTNVFGGVGHFDIQDNNSSYVTVTATLQEINTTFQAGNAVTFTPSSATASFGSVVILANDQSSDPGGPRTGYGLIGMYQFQSLFNAQPTIHYILPEPEPVHLYAGAPLDLAPLVITDDSGSQTVRLHLDCTLGSWQLSDSVPNGLLPAHIQILDEGKELEINAPLDRINTTLSTPGALLYLPRLISTGGEELEITYDDLGVNGSGSSQTAIATIAVRLDYLLPNEQPTIDLTPPTAVPFNGTLTMTGTVSDPDSGPHVVRVILECTHGTLGLLDSVPGGLTSGDFQVLNNRTTIDALAPVGKIMTTLHNGGNGGILYTAARGFYGIDMITATINDRGRFYRSGGDLLDSVTREIAILPPPPNQPPTITLDEGSKLVVGTTPISLGENQILLGDPDSALAPITTIFEVSAGTLSLARDIPGGLITSDITIEHGGRKLTVLAPIERVRTTLSDREGLRFLAGTIPPGVVTMTITINDHGYYGTGGAWETTNQLYLIKEGTLYDTFAFDLFGPAVASDVTLRDTVWGPNADPDNDGRPTAAEIFHGLNPLLRDGFGENSDSWIEIDTNGDLILYYRRSIDGAAIIEAEPQWTNNLLNFHTRNLVTELDWTDPEREYEIWRSSLPGIGPPLFMRLKFLNVD